MDNRLTFKNPDGSWGLKNFDIKKVPSELYGAMCKLLNYEESGVTPEETKQFCDEIEATVNAKKFSCNRFTEKKEPRMLLEPDSICYGCQNYKYRTDCIQDHVESDFDENDGACDIDTICCEGDKNGYDKRD